MHGRSLLRSIHLPFFRRRLRLDCLPGNHDGMIGRWAHQSYQCNHNQHPRLCFQIQFQRLLFSCFVQYRKMYKLSHPAGRRFTGQKLAALPSEVLLGRAGHRIVGAKARKSQRGQWAPRLNHWTIAQCEKWRFFSFPEDQLAVCYIWWFCFLLFQTKGCGNLSCAANMGPGMGAREWRNLSNT